MDDVTATLFIIKPVLGSMPTLMLWTGLNVLIVGLGIATIYIELVLALPLIGHAN